MSANEVCTRNCAEMIAGFDCRGDVWRVAAIDEDDSSGRRLVATSEVKTIGWVSSRTAIVGDSASSLMAADRPEKVFQLRCDGRELSGEAYRDSCGRTWPVEAQAALVFRKLMLDCLRLSGKSL